MKQLTENKIILIVRKTRLAELIARFNTLIQAQFYVEHLGADFSDYLNEHNEYQKAIAQTEKYLRRFGRLQILDRSFLPNFIFGERDLIVVLGQDGLVANTLKYLTSQFVIGVNPDPKRWDGILLPFAVNSLPRIMPEIFKGKRSIKEVTMAKAELNNGQFLYAVNDLFIGPKSHISVRYLVRLGEVEEQQSSSGIIVSTGLGSTGWFKSIVTGALGIAEHIFEKKIKVKRIGNFPWDAKYLYYSVREPFPSKVSSASLVFGQVTKERPMSILSQVSEGGFIFSDGVESDYLEFNAGTLAKIVVAEKRGHLVV